ncbi:MAG TPA: hypothetical protein VEA79_11105 [Phenylobacterium sp.]|nr:hypothetical protein [Phenylobacterium sp.]
MAARLKVFVTSDGLTDYVVAATSRPKALAAWGAHQDLFKTGQARETDDPRLVKAAQAQPGEVLRRSAGEPVLPKARPKTAKPKGPTKAQRERLAKAEAALDALETERSQALEAIAAERAALDRREADLARRLERAEAKARAALEAAKAAVERASA